MNRLYLLCSYLAITSLLWLALAACQPIRPESELTAPPAATHSSGVVTNTDTITETTPITGASDITETTGTPATEVVTETEAVTKSTTVTTPSTPTSGTTSSPPSSTPASGMEDVVSCPAIATAGGDSLLNIAIVANWEIGTQRHYIGKQQRIDIDAGYEVMSVSASTPITITVIDRNDDGYVLEWQYGNTEFGASDAEIPDPLISLLQTPLPIPFRYATSEDGVYLGLQDIDELRAEIEPFFDDLFELLAETDEELPREVLEAAQKTVEQLLEDPDNFDTLFTRDIQLLHTVFGFSFEDAEPLVLPDQRPNIFGGPPIPSELTVTPTHYDAEEGCLRVRFENVADPIAARNSILEALREQARQMGVPAPTDADLPLALEIVDYIVYDVDLVSGWPTAVSTERFITIGDQERIESSELQLVGTNEAP
jgi:hypothetical protein